MRLLVVTARYPTADRPAAGSFVRDRLADPALEAEVIAPARYDVPGWRRYLPMIWQVLAVRGRFDGVEGHFILPSGPLALLAARLRRLPLVIYAHGGDVREMTSGNRFLAWLARRVVSGADAVVTNSASSAEDLRRLGANARVVPPGVDLERFHPTPRPAERRVLYLGGEVPHKGVEIARQLADTLAGPGIRELPPEKVPALIAAHDVLLVPSLEEPFGLVAAEAIASGRWVVARAVGGLREVVSDGVNGTLVDRQDDLPAALAAVPDYDPGQVAATAARFDAVRHREGMARTWAEVRAARMSGMPGQEEGGAPTA